MTAALLALLPACSSTEQAAFDNWLTSPAVQAEIGDMTQFAFILLNGYLESQSGAYLVSQTGAPDFSGCESTVIASVQQKYSLNATEAAYVVKKAEARIIANAAAAKGSPARQHPLTPSAISGVRK
jgi:hypothetical protein